MHEERSSNRPFLFSQQNQKTAVAGQMGHLVPRGQRSPARMLPTNTLEPLTSRKRSKSRLCIRRSYVQSVAGRQKLFIGHDWGARPTRLESRGAPAVVPIAADPGTGHSITRAGPFPVGRMSRFSGRCQSHGKLWTLLFAGSRTRIEFCCGRH